MKEKRNTKKHNDALIKKPVIDFLRDLQYPYRKQAIKQCTNPHQIVVDKIDAIEVAFSWSQSEEGWEYWNNHWNNLINASQRKRRW